MDSSRSQALRDMGFTLWARRNLPTLESPAQPVEPAAPEPAVQPVEIATPEPQIVPSANPVTVPADWAELEAAVSSCTRCALAKSRQRTVFGVGARDARWMLVGEGPGAEEDKRGEPFVGRAGKLLDAMLAALGLARGEVFITNIVKCRPPGNRDPEPTEAEACRPYLERQIELSDPALILALGAVAAHRLLGVETPVGRLRGRAHEGPGGRPIVVTYHPAYLLRTPSAKRKSWEDLKLALATAAPRAP
ncbi:MAG: uracil-DNA glycosylase [Gammaproteobacteria bacterium]